MKVLHGEIRMTAAHAGDYTKCHQIVHLKGVHLKVVLQWFGLGFPLLPSLFSEAAGAQTAAPEALCACRESWPCRNRLRV